MNAPLPASLGAGATASPRSKRKTDPPAALYLGRVMHARLRPFQHRFTYRMAAMLIDLDRLDEADRHCRLLSVNRANLFSFHEADHALRTGKTLRQSLDETLAEHSLARSARIRLLCYPRLLGYVFNPVSVYFCEAADGRFTTLVYEVRNTFGGRHLYVEPVTGAPAPSASIRQQTKKALYVSPFLDMAMTYHFRVRPPGREIALRILETDARGPILAASFYGERRPLTAAALLKIGLQTFGLAWKVTAGIHFEAFRLWLKGAKIHPRDS